MFDCSKLMLKDSIDSYYEFLFIMAVAAECGRRGTSLDVSMMKLSRKNMLSDSDVDYMNYLKSIGSLYNGSDNNKDSNAWEFEKPKYYFNTNAITELYGVLFKEEYDSYYWDTEYAFKHYKKYSNDILNKKKIGVTLMHLAAHMLICFVLGEREEKKVKFYFKTREVETMYLYIDLLACTFSMEPVKKFIEICLDENYIDNLGDIEFNILYREAYHANSIKKWSNEDKLGIFKNYGFEEGSVAVLYKRELKDKKMSYNPVGKIVNSCVVRIDRLYYNDEGFEGWGVTTYNVNKTKEEQLDEYFGIDEDVRWKFKDLSKPKLNVSTMFLPFHNVGIGTYFFDEDYILMPIERDEKVQKKITIDGDRVVANLDDVETIYWILNEFNIDFDKSKFKKYYNNGNPLMWDRFDGTPNLNY